MTEIFEYNFTFTKFTKFWIYTINKKYWKNIETNLVYLSSYYKYNISKGDIIFIYILKDNHSIGFVICLKVKTDMLKNVNEIEIFKDSNMNNYYVKIASYYKFNTNYSVKKIDILMKQKCPSYISARKFKLNYIYGNASFCQLNYKVGIVLFSVLNQFEKIFLNICDDEDMIDEYISSKVLTTEYTNFDIYSLDSNIGKSKIIDDTSDDDETKNFINDDLENELSYNNSDNHSENYVNEDLENTSYNTNTSNSSKNYINEDLENQILENVTDNDSNNFINEDLENSNTISSEDDETSNYNKNSSSEDEVLSDSDNESIDNNSDKIYNLNFDISLIKNKVNIPILLIPCQDFKKKEMYQKILEHYFSCFKCMKYNNNTIELTKKNIQNMEIKIITKNSKLLDNIENSYMSIDDFLIKRNIIYYIEVDDAIHNKCFFIIN